MADGERRSLIIGESKKADVKGFGPREHALLNYLDDCTRDGREIKATREGEVISGQARIDLSGTVDARVVLPGMGENGTDADYPLMFLAEALSASDEKGNSRYITVDKENLEVTEISEISFSLESRDDLAKLFYDELVKRGHSIEEGKTFEYRKILNRLWEIQATDEEKDKISKINRSLGVLRTAIGMSLSKRRNFGPNVEKTYLGNAKKLSLLREKAVEELRSTRAGGIVADYDQYRFDSKGDSGLMVEVFNDDLQAIGLDGDKGIKVSSDNLSPDGYGHDPGEVEVFEEKGWWHALVLRKALDLGQLAKIYLKACRGMPIFYEGLGGRNLPSVLKSAREKSIEIARDETDSYTMTMLTPLDGVYVRIIFNESSVRNDGSGDKVEMARIGLLIDLKELTGAKLG